MTFTTVNKTYDGDTFGNAVAEMMRDPDIWSLSPPPTTEDSPSILLFGSTEAAYKGYSLSGWEWDARAHTLTCYFR